MEYLSVISVISTIWAFISWLPKRVYQMTQVGGREMIVKWRERVVSQKESNMDALLKLQQVQLRNPASFVKLGIESMKFDGIRGAHRPIGTISFYIDSFLVDAIRFTSDHTPCQVLYTTLAGDAVSIADSIGMTHRPTVQPCGPTHVTATFELPIQTRDELVVCNEKRTKVEWSMTPVWTFSIEGAQQEFAVSSKLLFAAIPIC